MTTRDICSIGISQALKSTSERILDDLITIFPIGLSMFFYSL